jgi:hypothetical protein
MTESEPFEEIKQKHERLLTDLEHAELSTKRSGALESHEELQWIGEAKRLLREISAAGKHISNPYRRSQLRTILRYWEDQIYEMTGEMPRVELHPALEGTSYEGPAYRLMMKRLKAQSRHAQLRILASVAGIVAFVTLLVVGLLSYDLVVCRFFPHGRWCPQNDRNLRGKSVFALASCDDGTLFAGAADGIYRRAADGTEWELGKPTEGDVTGLVASPDCWLVYAAAPRDGVLRWDGSSWSVVSWQGEMNQPWTVALSGSTILAGGNFGMRYSVGDESHTWVEPLTPVDKPVSSLVRSDGRIYAAVWGGGAWYCYKDNLDMWHPENDGLDTAEILQVVGSPANGAPRFAVADKRVFRWNGIRWEKGPETWGEARIFWIVTDGVTAYAGLERDGVLRSTDGGLTWEQMNAGWETPLFRVHTLLIHVTEDDRQWLYAGTSDGVWRYLLGKVPTCNGDFKRDFECWRHGGELDQTVECHGDQCYAVLGSPDYPCYGGVPVGEAWIKQMVKVPRIISPTLSFRYRVFSYDLDLPEYDYFQIAVNGEPLSERYGNYEWNEPSCDREPWDSGWMMSTLDLSAFRGEEEMSFHNINGTQPYYNTWTYVDDIRIDGVR